MVKISTDFILRRRAALICFGIVLAIGLWANPNLEPLPKVDTNGYIAVSENPAAGAAKLRPIGYPLLIGLSRLLAGARWEPFLILLQITAGALTAVMIFQAFQFLKAPTALSLIAAVVIGINPNWLAASRNLLPDQLLGVFVTAALLLTLRLICDRQQEPTQNLRLAIAIGLLSGFAALLKPIWVLGVVVFVMPLLLTRHLDWPQKRAIGMRLAGLHVLLVAIWQIWLIAQFGQFTPSLVSTANINLTLVRAGLTEYGEDTPLYAYLEEQGQLEAALALTWENFEEFKAIKNPMPGAIRLDTTFYPAVLAQDQWTFLTIQTQRMPQYWLSTYSDLSDQAFPGMPENLLDLYFRLFDVLFRPLTAWLFLLACIYGLAQIRLRPATLLFMGAILYNAVMIIWLTYQDSLIERNRASIEPAMFFFILLPLVLGGPMVWKRFSERAGGKQK